MDNTRLEYLFYEALLWIYEHTENTEDYARALRDCFFTGDEVKNELVYGCGLPDDEAEKIVRSIFDSF